jgi:hypothetical protein
LAVIERDFLNTSLLIKNNIENPRLMRGHKMNKGQINSWSNSRKMNNKNSKDAIK